MTTIDLKKVKYTYNTVNKTFSISEKDVPFATEYEIVSLKGNTMIFAFTHATGPEFNPNTKWIYQGDDGIILEVCNDSKMTAIAAANYFNTKMRN